MRNREQLTFCALQGFCLVLSCCEHVVNICAYKYQLIQVGYECYTPVQGRIADSDSFGVQLFLHAVPCLHVQVVFCRWFYADLQCVMFAPRASGSHERSVLFPAGNASRQIVRDGNLMAARVAFLLYYIVGLGHRFLLEQPMGSKAELFPALATFFEQFKAW